MDNEDAFFNVSPAVWFQLHHSDVISALKSCLSSVSGLLGKTRRRVGSVGAEAQNKRQNGEEAIF